MSRRKLSQEQRESLYSVTREEFMNHRKPYKTMRAVKERLYGMGWETILIKIVLTLVISWVTQWILGKLFSPPMQMPEDFGAEDLDENVDEPQGEDE